MALTRVSGGILKQPIDVGIITATSLNASGIVTAGTVQVGSATTIHTTGIDLGSGNVTSHNINSTGIITATSFVGPVTGNITATTGSFSGDVSIGGTLTYEDVTNIDSVGLITARSGINITNGELNFTKADGVGINFKESAWINIDSDNNDSSRNFQFIDAYGTGSQKTLMIVRDTGVVGINTNNPTASLQINSTTPKIILRDDDNGADISVASIGGAAVYSAASDNIFQVANTTEAMRITSAGDVGINTSTFAANGTNFKVSDGTISRLALDKTGANARKFEIGNFGTGLNVYDVTADEERLRITSDGSVGTGGLIASSGNLVVNSTIRSQNNSSHISYIGFTQYTGDTSVGSMFSYMGGDARNSGYLNFSTNDTERIRITSAGNVGIGLTNPSTKLHVQDSTASKAYFSHPTSNRTTLYIESDDTSARVGSTYLSGGSAFKPLDFLTSGKTRLSIRADGDVILGPYDAPGSYTTPANNIPYEIKVAPYGWQHHSELASISMGNHSGSTGNDDGEIVFKTAKNAHSDTTGLVEHLRITSFGKIGIDQTNPQGDLHIGNISGNKDLVMHAANNGNARVRFREGGSTTSGFNEYSIGMFGASNALTINGQGAGEIIRIMGDNGLVGINTDNPSEKLEVNGPIRSGSSSPGARTEGAGFRQYAVNTDGVSNRLAYNVYDGYYASKSFSHYFPNGVSNRALRIHSNRSSWWTCGFITIHSTYSNQNASGMLRYHFRHAANGTSNYGKSIEVDVNIGNTSGNFGMSNSYTFKGWGSNGGSADSHALEVRHLTSTGNGCYITIELYGTSASTYIDDLYMTTGHTY